MVRAYHQCEALLSARLAVHGLRLAEHEILVNLQVEPGISQQVLAVRCFAAKSGVSMLITRMENDGLVRRETDGDDGRAKRLMLTRKGEKLAAKCLAVQSEIVNAMAATLTAKELGQLEVQMLRLSARIVIMTE